jgi:hypothetical protein
MADETIQATIAKLLAKAKGTNNEHEAALFAAKAAELLAKHNLTEAMIAARDGAADEPVVEQRMNRKTVAKWRQTIASGCAKLYFCRVLLYGSQLDFVGKKHNAEVALSMCDWLCSVVVRMAREYSTDRLVMEDFKRGAALRLYQRLMALYREQNPPQPVAQPVANVGGLPALYASEAKAVDDYIDRQYGALKSRKGRGLALRGSGASAGYDRAGGINLSSQVAERRSSRMIGRS